MKRTLVELENIRRPWAMQIFPEATAISSLRKLEEEIEEIENDINHDVKDPIEYADAMMCLFDSAARHGISAAQIRDAFEEKLEINLNRKWKKNPNNTYSHVK